MNIIDWKTYLDTYPDLRQNGVLTKEQAINHWNNHGKNEGRICNFKLTYINWQNYLNTYSDLRENGIHTEEQAINHWVEYGQYEGIECSKFNYIINSKNKLFNIKNNVENSDIYYTHYEYKNVNITENTISIIMTSTNRSIQTYFTLNTISTSLIKDIQIIIVDDSDIDIIDENKLKDLPFYVDLIKINRNKKEWFNPCINYNIGFKFIKGNYIIIQNAEICHIGDVSNFIRNNITDNNYYTFDVKASLDFDTNNIIYNLPLDINIYNREELFLMWYQSINLNRNYHFLSAMTKTTFDNIKCFSYDYSIGYAWDDDDFLLRIISKKININNVFHDIYNIGGIHLYHNVENKPTIQHNQSLYNLKKNIYDTTKEYIELIENIEEFDNKCKKYLC